MPHSDEIFKRGLSSNTQDAVRSYCWERILVFERSFRSALYSSPAKIEHSSADSNGSFTGKTKHSTNYGCVFRYIFEL